MSDEPAFRSIALALRRRVRRVYDGLPVRGFERAWQRSGWDDRLSLCNDYLDSPRVSTRVQAKGDDPMREELQKREGMRLACRGVFVRFGEKRGWQGRVETTVLLQDITDAHGNALCDHVWLNLTKEIAALDLQPGDVVCFEARVKPYTRGYRGWREDVYAPVSKDYKLSHPTKVRKVADDDPGQLPLFASPCTTVVWNAAQYQVCADGTAALLNPYDDAVRDASFGRLADGVWVFAGSRLPVAQGLNAALEQTWRGLQG